MKKVIRQFFIALCLLAVPMGLSAQTLVFHLAGGTKTTVTLPATFTVTPTGNKLVIDDGNTVVELNKDDVICVTYRDVVGDVNGDQRVDVADLSTIVGIIVGKDGGMPDKAPKDAVAVDLGLPSGTKWANMNVGAEKPEDYGLYFAWGETVGYGGDTSDGISFDWGSYKWMNKGQSSGWQISKYQWADGKTNACWYDNNGNFIGDGKTTLELADDAARANWGGRWVIPTQEECRELLANTTSEWTTVNGVIGRKYTSIINSNSIFLPAADIRAGSNLPDYNNQEGAIGAYWTASLSLSFDPNYYSEPPAHLLFLRSMDTYTAEAVRCQGYTIRPILRK